MALQRDILKTSLIHYDDFAFFFSVLLSWVQNKKISITSRRCFGSKRLLTSRMKIKLVEKSSCIVSKHHRTGVKVISQTRSGTEHIWEQASNGAHQAMHSTNVIVQLLSLSLPVLLEAEASASVLPTNIQD